MALCEIGQTGIAPYPDLIEFARASQAEKYDRTGPGRAQKAARDLVLQIAAGIRGLVFTWRGVECVHLRATQYTIIFTDLYSKIFTGVRLATQIPCRAVEWVCCGDCCVNL